MSNPNNLTIEIAIPVLNEERTLNQQILKLVNYVTSNLSLSFNATYFITIADNGSSDNTSVIAKDLTKKFPNLVRYVRVEAIGAGLALKKAWQTSKADIVGYMDLDFSIDLNQINVLLNSLIYEHFLFVYCSRAHKESVVINKKWYRRLFSKGVNCLLAYYLKTPIKDPTGSPKFFYKKYLNELLDLIGPASPSFWFNGQIFIAAQALDLNFKVFPVKWIDHPSTSQIKIIPTIIQMLKDMKTFKPYLNKIKRNKIEIRKKFFL